VGAGKIFGEVLGKFFGEIVLGKIWKIFLRCKVPQFKPSLIDGN
jgi:hypothetical protein